MRGRIVQVGLENGYRVAAALGLDFADHHAEHVGKAFAVARAGAVADRPYCHCGKWAELRCQRGQQGRGGGCEQLALLIAVCQGNAGEQLRRGRRGDRQLPVRGGNSTLAQRYG